MAQLIDFQFKTSVVAGREPTPTDFAFEGVPSLGVMCINAHDQKAYLLAEDLTTVFCIGDAARLAGAIQASQIGAANGVAPLDAQQKLPVANLPAVAISGLMFQGTWNAATNTPTLVSGSGTEGHYYVVSTAGATVIDGQGDWNPKDWAVFTNGGWTKIDNTAEPITAITGGTF